MESQSTTVPTVPTSAKKPKLAVNLGDVLDEEDASGTGTGGEEDGLIAINNHSGFTFQWRDVKAGRGKVTAIVTLFPVASILMIAPSNYQPTINMNFALIS